MPVYWHRGRIFMWFPFLADTNNIEHVLDLFDLDWYRSHRLKRFDIAYVAESHAGDELSFFMEKVAAEAKSDEEEYLVRIVRNGEEESEVVRCSIKFVKN